MYEGKKVYGPYTRKDGRQIVILKTPGVRDQQTVSYPKYLVERYLNRFLNSDETVDHIDGNFSNNDLSNLRVVPRVEHCRSHTSKRAEIQKRCVVCGKVFETDEANRLTCGSRVCRGKCAHMNGYNQGHSFLRDSRNSYESLRDCIKTVTPITQRHR